MGRVHSGSRTDPAVKCLHAFRPEPSGPRYHHERGSGKTTPQPPTSRGDCRRASCRGLISEGRSPSACELGLQESISPTPVAGHVQSIGGATAKNSLRQASLQPRAPFAAGRFATSLARAFLRCCFLEKPGSTSACPVAARTATATEQVGQKQRCRESFWGSSDGARTRTCCAVFEGCGRQLADVFACGRRGSGRASYDSPTAPSSPGLGGTWICASRTCVQNGAPTHRGAGLGRGAAQSDHTISSPARKRLDAAHDRCDRSKG